MASGGMVSRLRLFSILLCIAGLCLAAPSTMAFDDVPGTPDARDKALYILKFHRFATWPQGMLAPGATLVIGVAGAEKIAQALDQEAAQRPADKRPVNVVRLQPGDPLTGIHILFIGNDQSPQQMQAWLAQAKGKPVLCVTDNRDSMPAGSMINLVQDNDRTRFDVSLTAAEHSRIELSAALLTVAREVYGGKK